LPVYRTSELFTPIERLALDLATALSQTPAVVPDELRDELLVYFSPAQVTELAAAIAWENHRARLNRALGIRPMGFSDGAYCVVPHGARG
jgi:alkylhydroperoxidase family enzyme